MATAKHAVLLRFDPAVLDRVDRYRNRRQLRSRAAAIDELLARGLATRNALGLAIVALRELRDELTRVGVVHAGVFGSVARSEADEESDIDVVIAFDHTRAPDLFGFMKLCDRIADHIGERTGRHVDVANFASLRERVRERVAREAVYAF